MFVLRQVSAYSAFKRIRKSTSESKYSFLSIMSVKEYPNASMVKPHRCAFLMDDIIDAVHHWDKAEMKDAYRTWRACMKNKEINTDLSQKPRYVNPKENSDGSE